MGLPAAKLADQVMATDQHLIQPAGPGSPFLALYDFNGIIDDGLSRDVLIDGWPAATVGSTATNTTPHVASGGTFVLSPSNRAIIVSGSATVLINGRPAVRLGDTVLTCNDPVNLPVGSVIASSSVLIGG